MEFNHTEDIEGVLDKCQVLINEFQKSTDLPPGRLIYIEKKLSAYYAFLIRRKAYYQAMQNAQYWIRKISHSRESIKARAAGAKSQTQADHTALGLIKTEIDNETHAVWRYEDLNGFCRGLDKVFIAISHQLKDYEREKINTR